MANILFENFIHKVLTSTERVQFSHVDPYGHLNTSKYVEFFINHRIHSAEQQLECYTMDIVKELSIGFVVHDMQLRFFIPCFQGELLEIASWMNEKSDYGFSMYMTMSSASKRKVKAIAKVHFVSVDMKSGRSIELPKKLPSRSDLNLISERPSSTEYMKTISGLPEGIL